MSARFACCAAVFVLMALSNAVVPVLDTFAEGAALQGLIFSGYFFGAMLTVLPAGLASERYGRLRLMRLGIAGTCVAGLAIAFMPSAPVVAIARVAEGVMTGLFVSASLAFVNSRQDNGRLSGLYMASLNAGLLVGLIATGALVQVLWTADRGGDRLHRPGRCVIRAGAGRGPGGRDGRGQSPAAPGPGAPPVPLALLRHGRDLRRGRSGDRAISGVLLGRAREHWGCRSRSRTSRRSSRSLPSRACRPTRCG